MTVKEIVAAWLKEKGYDGLCDGECHCAIDNLFPDNCCGVCGCRPYRTDINGIIMEDSCHA